MEFNLIESRNYKKYKDGNTFLHIAASRGNLNDLKELFQTLPQSELNTIIEAKNKFGSTPLHYATWAGQLDIVKYLVDQGADLKTKDIYDQTLLHAAAWNGHLRLVEFYFEQGLSSSLEDRDNRGNTPLLSAAQYPHPETVKWLISQGADVQVENVNGDTVLFLAAESANLDIIDFLVRGKQIDLSVRKGDDTLLHLAILKNSEDEEGPDIRPFVKGLLQYPGVNIDAQDSNGDTPLHIASMYANTQLVQSLIAQGANINTENNAGQTPLDLAKVEKESEDHSQEVRQKYLTLIRLLEKEMNKDHQESVEELGNFSIRDEDLSRANLLGPTQENKIEKRQQRSKKTRYDSSPLDSQAQAIASPSTFDMRGLNESLTSLNSTSRFFTTNPQATQAEVSPFNLSSISEREFTGNDPETSHLAMAASLFGSALSSRHGLNSSSNTSGNEESERFQQILDAIETFPNNMTTKYF